GLAAGLRLEMRESSDHLSRASLSTIDSTICLRHSAYLRTSNGRPVRSGFFQPACLADSGFPVALQTDALLNKARSRFASARFAACNRALSTSAPLRSERLSDAPI